MKTLDHIMEGLASTQAINKSLAFNNSISKILRPEKTFHDQFEHTMQGAIMRSIGLREVFAAKKILDDTLALKYKIPSATLTAVNSIVEQHKELFGHIRSYRSVYQHISPALAQINSFQSTLGKISGQMAAIAAVQKQWDLLKDFESISGQAINIANKSVNNVALTEEESLSFKKLIVTLLSFVKRNKKYGIYSLLFVDILLRIAALHQYYDFVQTKPELATKEDIAKSSVQFMQLTEEIKNIEEKLKEEKEYRITNTICNVRLKPQYKTLVIAKLPVNFDVIVLQVNHKWVYVSYINQKDNLPQTGWVLKKYLNQPR